MKCPECGHELSKNLNKKALANAIYSRLEEYGYPSHMTPDKNYAYIGIRKVIIIRLYGMNEVPKDFSDEYYEKALSLLEVILPPKE